MFLKTLFNHGIHPPKTNMEPEKDGFQKEISFSRGPFSGSMLVFGGVNYQPQLLIAEFPSINSSVFLKIEQKWRRMKQAQIDLRWQRKNMKQNISALWLNLVPRVKVFFCAVSWWIC